MATSKSGGPAAPQAGPPKDGDPRLDERPPADEIVAEADEESFPASDAPGWISQTTIGPPARGPVARPGRSAEAPPSGIPPADRDRRDPGGEEASDASIGPVE